jgi:gamma-polyglutamate biosynthesis protein CapA
VYLGYMSLKKPPQLNQASKICDPQSITMAFAGDVMLSRGVGNMIQSAGKGDYTWPWLKVANDLRQADITFVNLESQISDKGRPAWARLAGPWFEADPQAVEGLRYAGVDIVSVANNHCFDYGADSLKNSLNNLSRSGIKYTGVGSYEEAYTPTYITAKGKKVAFLAYTNQVYPWYRSSNASTALGINLPSNWGAAWLNYQRLDEGIDKARTDGADIIVVSMHYGVEYDTTPSAAELNFARHAIDRGAHLVIGHGPHVIQPVMNYKHGVIALSLGNFIFDLYERVQPGVSRGMVLEVQWQYGGITKVYPRYTRNNETTWQPEFETASLP